MCGILTPRLNIVRVGSIKKKYYIDKNGNRPLIFQYLEMTISLNYGKNHDLYIGTDKGSSRIPLMHIRIIYENSNFPPIYIDIFVTQT